MRTRSRALALVLFDEVELLDVAAPLQALTLAGRQWNFRPFKVFAVAAQPGTIQTRNQLALEAPVPLADCPSPELLLVPGGYGARRALADDGLVAWLEAAGASAELVLGVGNGVLLLGAAGLLDGRETAIPKSAAAQLAEVAPLALPRPGAGVVDAGKVLTAGTSIAALDLGLLVIARTLGAKMALGVAAELGHTPGITLGAPEPPKVEIKDVR